MTDIAIALAIGLGVFGPAIGIGLIGFAALTGIGRNPSAAGEIKSTMILAIAFAEDLGVFSLLVALLLKFV